MFEHVMPEIISLFLMIGLGVLLKRKGFIGAEVEAWLSSFTLYISIPSTLIISIYNTDIVSSGVSWLTIFALAGFSYLFLFLSALVIVRFARCEAPRKKALLFLTMFNNVGNLAFPVVGGIYGSKGMLYATAFNIIFNLLLWTFGMWLLTGERGQFRLKRLLSPPLIAIIAGYAGYLLRVPIPDFLDLTLSNLASTLSPLSMLIIGSLLASIQPRIILTDKVFLRYVLSKQLILPILFLYVAKIIMPDPDTAAICTLMIAMPCAVSNAAFMSKYYDDGSLAARAVVMTTPVALATFPLLLFLSNLF